MAEAAAQLQKGLDQLALLPDDPKRQRQELELRISQGTVLWVVKGVAAPERGQAYTRARELWEQLGTPSEFLQVPFGQSIYHMFRSEFDLAQRLNEDLLRLSRQRNDSAGLVLGHYSSSLNLMFVGKFPLSRLELEEVLALHDPISHRSLVQQAAVHPHVTSAFRTRHWHGAAPQSRRLEGWLIRRLWLRACHSAPFCSRSSETTQSSASG
jgi:hypothetical protein